MDLSLELNQTIEQTIKVSPTLIAVNHILALSSQELQALIKQEAEENPAFEIIEHQTCNICGEVLKNGICLSCSRSSAQPQTPAAETMDESALGLLTYKEDVQLQLQLEDTTYSSYSSYPSLAGGEDDDFDPMSLVAAEATMRERLLMDMRSVLDAHDIPIADYLIGSLDDRGFLGADLESIAFALNVPVERVEHVLSIMKAVGPAGIGAKDHRECLLLQLDQIERDTGQRYPHVRRILEDYFVELGEHKYNQIAQKMGISLEEVDEAREFIRSNLTPYPVIWTDDEVATWGRLSSAQYVTPDVIIKEIDGEFEVEVVESRRFFMRINPLYSQMAAQIRARELAVSEDEKRHVQQYVSRTKLFISNIKQRRETLTKIAKALVEYQEEFLRHGIRHLRPLTRAQIAEVTGLHESTVSRATAGKYVMLPNRQVIPFSDFFTASLSIKDVIKEIIEKEGKPMADREIVARLRERGIRIARRTVAKYRSQLGILPSTLR
jgi:RNA polymerase sigma-54 factor